MGTFYLYYMTVMTFMGNGLLLLQIARLILNKLKARDAFTTREELMAWVNVPYDIGYESATHMTCMIIAFSYVITTPVVCVLGALYYNIRYFVDKYNLLCLFYIPFESKG
jgi:hypothetical protein